MSDPKDSERDLEAGLGESFEDRRWAREREKDDKKLTLPSSAFVTQALASPSSAQAGRKQNTPN